VDGQHLVVYRNVSNIMYFNAKFAFLLIDVKAILFGLNKILISKSKED